MNHVGFVVGLASGFWYVHEGWFISSVEAIANNLRRVGYAMTFWNNDHGLRVAWRYSLALSFIPAIIFLIGLPFMHDS